uniref:uncharacterized protein LOC105351964 n=1 Tax=Fragaria vesca subsp. vesca TaxID=101020 RepID=UPI0005C91D82|nr:PREDICTED: uncharacterized protein LOC105351964 [Fragaria vesca subsp. vesca]
MAQFISFVYFTRTCPKSINRFPRAKADLSQNLNFSFSHFFVFFFLLIRFCFVSIFGGVPIRVCCLDNSILELGFYLNPILVLILIGRNLGPRLVLPTDWCCRSLSAMDPGKLGEILKHLETQNELLTNASESVIQELSKLRGEEEMMMRKYYAIMSEHGKVKKVQELHEFWQKHGHREVSTDNETGNSTALVTVNSEEEN